MVILGGIRLGMRIFIIRSEWPRWWTSEGSKTEIVWTCEARSHTWYEERQRLVEEVLGRGVRYWT